MTPGCRQVRRFLPAYYDRALGEAKAAAVEEHLAVCAVCRTEVAHWKRIAGALEKLESPAPPPDFAGRVMASIDSAGRPAKQRRGLKLPAGIRPWLAPGLARVVAAAAVLAVIACGSWSLAAKYWHGVTGPTIAHREEAEPPAVLPPQEKNRREAPPEQLAPPPRVVPGANNTQVPDSQAPPQTAPRQVTPPKALAERPPAGAKREWSASPAASSPAASVAGSSGRVAFAEPRVFLNKERQITSSFLRVAVPQLDAAEAEARTIGQRFGAKIQELARGQAGARQQVGLKFTVETTRANLLLVRLIGLGKVLDRGSQTQDISADFAATLELYRYWVGLRNTVTDAAEAEAIGREIERLEKQLATWDEEAERQVIVLWLEEE